MEAVFELIQTLSKSEKAHFKKYAEMHSYKKKSPQLSLFELIDKQKTYDEKILKQKLKAKNFSLVKFSLNEMLHASLRSYHEQNTDTLKSLSYLQSIEILIQKNLINQAEQINKKVKKIALSNENTFVLTKVLQNELRFLTVPKSLAKNTKINDDVYQLLFITNQQYNITNESIYLLSLLTLPTRQGFNKNNSTHLNIINKIKESKLLQTKDEDLNTENLLNKYRIHGILSGFNGNVNDNLNYHQNLIKILESNPKILRINPRGYLGAYRNFFGASIQAKNWGLAKTIIFKLKTYIEDDIISKNKQIKLYLIESYLSAFGYYFANKPNLTIEDEKEINDIENSIFENSKISTQLREDSIRLVYYYLALIYLRLKNYGQALNYINNYQIYKTDSNKFKRIELAIKLVQIICLYELEDIEVCENLIRSFKRIENNYYANNEIIMLCLKQIQTNIEGDKLISFDCSKLIPQSDLEIASLDWLTTKCD